MRIMFIETNQSNFFLSLELFYASNILYLGIALSEITTMIEGTIISFDTSPIFMLNNLRKMYQKKTKTTPWSTRFCCKNVNLKRLKEAIINQVPGLCKQKSGKLVSLTLDGVIGKAIFQFSINSSKDEGIILGNAA